MDARRVRSVAEFQSNNVVLATTVLLRRLEEIDDAVKQLGDPVLIAMIEKMRRQLTTGKGLDGHGRIALKAPAAPWPSWR
jgi:hypothetical protein